MPIYPLCRDTSPSTTPAVTPTFRLSHTPSIGTCTWKYYCRINSRDYISHL